MPEHQPREPGLLGSLESYGREPDPPDDEAPFSGGENVGPRHIGYILLAMGVAAPTEFGGATGAWLVLGLAVAGILLMALDEFIKLRSACGSIAAVGAFAAGNALWEGVTPVVWAAGACVVLGCLGLFLLRPARRS